MLCRQPPWSVSTWMERKIAMAQARVALPIHEAGASMPVVKRNFRTAGRLRFTTSGPGGAYSTGCCSLIAGGHATRTRTASGPNLRYVLGGCSLESGEHMTEYKGGGHEIDPCPWGTADKVREAGRARPWRARQGCRGVRHGPPISRIPEGRGGHRRLFMRPDRGDSRAPTVPDPGPRTRIAEITAVRKPFTHNRDRNDRDGCALGGTHPSTPPNAMPRDEKSAS